MGGDFDTDAFDTEAFDSTAWDFDGVEPVVPDPPARVSVTGGDYSNPAVAAGVQN